MNLKYPLTFILLLGITLIFDSTSCKATIKNDYQAKSNFKSNSKASEKNEFQSMSQFRPQFSPQFSFKTSTPFHQIKDEELLDYLLGKAVTLSGLQQRSIEDLPPIYQLSKENLAMEVCPDDPENCRNLAAVFDDIHYRILVLEDFELTSNFIPYNYSFVIHEIIHFLQYRQYGAEIFHGCDQIYETENLAYNSQDKYLESEGDFHRVSHFLRFGFFCDPDIAEIEYQKSKTLWEKRNSTGFFIP